MKPQVLKGFRDYGPEEMIVRQQMLDKVRVVFESFGYAPLHTPALEYAAILLGKYGDEGEKLLYKFQDHGGRTVALRYDLTVPLARYVGMNPNLRFPFRRYQIAPVWRAERPQKGRFREFYQCDVDLIGVDSAQADAECILVDYGVLDALGLTDFRIMVSHRGYLDGLLESLQIPSDKVVSVLRILDKVDKITADEMTGMLSAEGLSSGQVEPLVGLGRIDGDNVARLEASLALAGGHEKARSATQRLAEAFEVVEASLGASAPVHFNPAIARGLDYYTGIVYETFLPSRYGVGSVMSGGRYDNLLGTMSGKEIPAVGISLGIDRLVAALSADGPGGPAGVSRVLVCLIEGTQRSAARAAAVLRKGLAGTGVELFPRTVKLKKQFEYANKKGISVLALVGPDEEAQGLVTLRSMESGEQFQVPFAEAAGAVARLIED